MSEAGEGWSDSGISVAPPIHEKAMPVILTTPEEIDLRLTADTPKALELQRPQLAAVRDGMLELR